MAGLSTQSSLRSHAVKIPNTGLLAGDVPAVAKSAAVPPSGPGSYTVLDLAAKYNINPLYAKGLTTAVSPSCVELSWIPEIVASVTPAAAPRTSRRMA